MASTTEFRTNPPSDLVPRAAASSRPAPWQSVTGYATCVAAVSLAAMLCSASVSKATSMPAPGHSFPREYIELRSDHPELFDSRGGLQGMVDRAKLLRTTYLSTARRVAVDRQRRSVITESGEFSLDALAVTGTVRIPVVPVLFTPNTTPAPPTAARINEILFTGPNPPFGTARDYYNEISYGLVTLTGTVFAYTTVPNSSAYYAGTSSGLDPATSRTGELLRDALNGLDPGTDFGQFDNDGPDGTPNSGDDDGFVDLISFLTPQAGGECGNGNIWAHRWRYANWNAGAAYSTNDARTGFPGQTIRINDYNIQGALTCGNGEMQIGTFCHETGHIFGIPDLYDTRRMGTMPSAGDGDWTLMAGGNWNTQASPAHMSVWEKNELGWLIPTLVSSSVSGVQIPQVETNAAAIQVALGNGELFLIENRQPVGFDRNLRTCGLAIWHVDQGLIDARRSSNAVNTTESCGTIADIIGQHYGLALVQADGQCHLEANTNRGDAGDLYPGSSDNRLLTRLTTPASGNYVGPSNVSVANISACGATMTADIDAFPVQTVPGPVDVVFLVDNSGSYIDDWPNIQAQMPSIVAKLQSNYSDMRLGLALFRDFPFAPFGQAGDFAYRAVLPLAANNSAAFLDAIATLSPPGGGNDLPESQYEALHQLLSGTGRDLYNNGVPGDQTGEISPSSIGWDAARTRIVYLLTDSDFHDADAESYPTGTTTAPVPTLEAAGRASVRAEVAALGNGLKLFVLVAENPGAYITQGPDGSIPNLPQTELVQQALELAGISRGGVFSVGSASEALEDIVEATIDVVLDQPGVNRPPDCANAVASKPVLWPPNHRYQPVSVRGITDPDGDAVMITVLSVTQDERVNTRGDGNTCPDALIVDGQVSLRAERSGTAGLPGNGRVYAINFLASDGHGGECMGTVQVCVPHDLADPSCVDDGQQFASNGDCRGDDELQPEIASYDLHVEIVTRSTAAVDFELPRDDHVQVAVYDVSGRRVAMLENGSLAAGSYRREWNMSAVPNGIYFVRMRAGTANITRTVIRAE